MKYIHKLLQFFFLLIMALPVMAQTNKEKAVQKATEAIKLEDEEGKYDEAIVLFDEAEKMDPGSVTYLYEKALAYSGKKEFKKASDLLEKLITYKDVHDLVYQQLGNSYDLQGNPEKAIEIYEKGLKKFPNSGELYLERGNMEINNKKYENALGYYEKGIYVDPKFPSNYYWASRIYCSSSEEVWGMVYGEIFMNMERNSKRTEEISKLLFNTYKSEIKFTSDTSMTVSFSKNSVISADALKSGKKIKLPFGTGCYEICLMMGVGGEHTINLNSLDRIRTGFLSFYYKGPSAKDYRNILFDYQKQIKDAGHFEAYNHWLLMKGDEDEFENWQKANNAKWTNFLKWFSDNKMVVDDAHRFYSGQY